MIKWKTCKAATNIGAGGGCKDATQGKDKCWGHVMWAMKTGIITNPKWYPGLNKHSTFAEFQCELSQPNAHHGKKGKDCEGFQTPCGLTNVKTCKAAKGNCKTATKGKDKCWRHVNWAMTKGIHTNPSWYAGLSYRSTFEEFQCELSRPSAKHGQPGGDCEGFTPCKVNLMNCRASQPQAPPRKTGVCAADIVLKPIN
eukprot:COSAG01_NODE_28821_length_652_cov_0.685353_1_plen_197_part_10